MNSYPRAVLLPKTAIRLACLIIALLTIPWRSHAAESPAPSVDRLKILAIGHVAASNKIPTGYLIATETQNPYLKKTFFFTVTRLNTLPHDSWLVAISGNEKKILERNSVQAFLKTYNTLIDRERVSFKPGKPDKPGSKPAAVIDYVREVLRLWQPTFAMLDSQKAAIELFPDLEEALKKIPIQPPAVSQGAEGKKGVTFYATPYWMQIWRFTLTVTPSGAIQPVVVRPVLSSQVPLQ